MNKRLIMKDIEKIEKLREAFEEVIWMAIRYADGRHTYAPNQVRDAIRLFKSVYPDWKPKKDVVINPPREEDINGMSFISDYLFDLFEDEQTTN